MKQIPLYRSLGLFLNLFFLIVAFTACKKQNSEIETSLNQETTFAKGGSVTYPEVPLSMTVNNASGDKITSDGTGAYVNGSQNVKVLFDKNGNFFFTTRASNNPNVPMVRWLNYNFNSPISPNPPVTGMETGSNLSGVKSASTSAYTPLQNLAVGASQCIALSGGIINFDPRTINFHSNTEDISNTPSAFAYITRTSATEWIISPVPPSGGGCSSNTGVGAFVTNNGALVWYYNLPFSFTLTAL